ncbi:MAG: hypothetical protein ABJ004_07740 [Cyclobacteriaceae bacterium]
MKKKMYILIIAGLTILGVEGVILLGKSKVSEVILETSFAEVGDVSTDITGTGKYVVFPDQLNDLHLYHTKNT